MTTLTVYSNSSDGFIRASGGGGYLGARAGSGSLTVLTDFSVLRVGQQLDSTWCDEAFLDFDTSAIPDSATIDSVVLHLYGHTDFSTTDFTIEARLFDWGGTLTDADWVPGDDLDDQTLLATFATSGFAEEAYNAFTDVAFPANINKTGTTSILLCSSRLTAGTQPSGEEWVYVYEADETGTTKDPKLVINYTAGTELVVQDATHSHTADSPTLTQDHSLAVADATHAHSADNLALTQDHTLVVADSLHAHSADNLTVEEGGTDLVVDDSVHSHTAEEPTLTQVHELVVADSSHAHSAETIVLAGSSQISFKRSQTLPRVVHQIASPYGDDNPLVDGWEAREIAPGGYESASGTIDAKRVLDRPDVYKFGSHWRMYDEETGECIWAGRLLDPAINGGKAQLSARGWGTIPDREAGRLLYQTYSLEDWQANPEFSDGAGSRKYRGDVSTIGGPVIERIAMNYTEGGAVGTLQWRLDNVGFTWLAFEAEGFSRLSRIRFDARLYGSDDQALSLLIGSPSDTSISTGAIAGWVLDTCSGDMTVEVDQILQGAGFLADPSITHNNVYRIHLKVIDLTSASSELIDAYGAWPAFRPSCLTNDYDGWRKGVTLQFENLRVNGIAFGDDFSASQLTADLCGRMGIDDSLVQDSAVNVLPLDHQEGSYAELLDYASALGDWRWVIHDNGKGGGPVMDFGPWTTRRWTLTDEHARVDLLPTERWNKLTVSYRDPQRGRHNQVTVRADPDPLPIDNNYGRIGLGQAFPDDSRPRQIAETLMDYLSKNRPAGTADIAMVRDETGQLRPAYHVRAGDVLDIPWRNAYGLRIKETHKTANGITLTFDESLAPLTSLAARKQRRLSSR